ncbi:MAG: Wzz/FepE/Etk N-terminal domain-containing protein, partial [Acinetobacter sp.]
MKEEMGAVRSTSTDKEIDLLQLLGALFTQWKMIISVTAGFMLAALFYALLTPPVYQADTLIQVEQKQGQALLSSLSSVLPDSAPEVAPEIELLKSRMILGKTVDDLNLKTQAEQIAFPVVGRLWSRLTGEKTGQIMIQKMTLPLTDGKSPALVLTVEENDAYLLEGENLSLRGKVGQLLKGKDIAILISAIQASPGTRFSLHQQTLLEAINGLQKSVSVAIQGKGSGMLVLSITGHHPDKLVMILNSITDNYLQQNVARQA